MVEYKLYIMCLFVEKKLFVKCVMIIEVNVDNNKFKLCLV